MLKEMFKKTSGLSKSERRQVKKGEHIRKNLDEPQIPDGLFEKCDSCGDLIYAEDIVSNYYICPHCGHYFRIRPRNRIRMIVDKDSFVEWDEKLEISDPLQFPGYQEKVERIKEVTNLEEAVMTGKATIKGNPVVIGVMASNFMMGSMGYVVGEKITRAVERATEEKLPVILFTCSGGARMQEGIISLMQMAKTAQALKRHDEAGLLYITMLTDPTTGGVTASFAMLGDIILAEPGCLIGFAGQRVIEQTIRQKLPEGFQRAEFLLEHGFVDKIVERKHLRQILALLLRK